MLLKMKPEAEPVHTAEAMRPAVDPDIPPPPEMHPKLGDKTPAYVNWIRTYFPAEYEERYKGRKTHLTTGINPHVTAGDIPQGHMAAEATEERRA
jgi:hypothetical protein